MNQRNISHIEIPGRNRTELEKLATFYADVFNWETQDMSHGPVHYIVWQAGNMRGGFAIETIPSDTHGVLLYLSSNNIDNDLAKITANGGSISREKTAYPAGWYAHFIDSAGNKMGLAQLKTNS